MPTPSATYIENRERIQPNQTNNYDSAHGGEVMRLMDEIGAMSAMRFAGSDCVTARMEQVNFRRPIPVGDNALLKSYVYDTGETSVRVRIRAFRENPRTAEAELTTDSHLVYVAIDDDLDPVSVPELTVSSERGEELQAAALASSKHDA